MVKNPLANAGDPGSGRSSGEGNGNPRQYSCLENSEEPGGLQSMGSQSQTRLSTHAGISSCIFTMGGCVLAFNHLPCYYSGMVLARGNKTGALYSRYFRKVKKKKKAQKDIIREDWGRRKGKTEKEQIPKGKAAG